MKFLLIGMSSSSINRSVILWRCLLPCLSLHAFFFNSIGFSILIAIRNILSQKKREPNPQKWSPKKCSCQLQRDEKIAKSIEMAKCPMLMIIYVVNLSKRNENNTLHLEMWCIAYLSYQDDIRAFINNMMEHGTWNMEHFQEK